MCLTLKTPRKPASENVVCWIFLQTYQTYFCIQANSVDPDQTAPKGAVWSGSTLFAEMTFKITSRWQSRRQLQLLWLAVLAWIESRLSCVHSPYHHFIEGRKDIPILSLFSSWSGAVLHPQWLELPVSRTNFYGPKVVWAIEIRLHFGKKNTYHLRQHTGRSTNCHLLAKIT